MTKKEAQEMLINTKVYVNGKSKEIQEKLFEVGFSWSYSGYKVIEVDKPFLFIDKDMYLSHSTDMNYFKGSQKNEISAEEIIAITIEGEYPFKTFDKVLIRDSERDEWKAGIFSHVSIKRTFPFVTINNCHKQCIPYEGNEHLVGTTNSPKK